MFANHMCVYGVSIDVYGPTDDVSEPGGVQHRAGANDARVRQARDLSHLLREDVDRITHDDQCAAGALKLLADGLHHGRVVAKQIQTRFAGSASSPSGDNNYVGIRHFLDRRGPDESGWIERRAVRQIHGFTFSRRLAGVVKKHFIGDA